MSSVIDKIKSKLGASNPVSDEQREEIITLVKENMEEYKKNYNEAFVNISKEKKKEGKDLDFNEIDKEAKEEAGLDIVKENVSNTVKEEVLPEIIAEIPQDSKEMGKKVAEKAVEKIVDGAIDKIVKELSKEQKEKMKQEKVEIQTQKEDEPLTAAIEEVIPEKIRNICFQSTVGPSHEPITTDFDINLTVEELKTLVGEKFGLPSEEFHFSYEGRTMDPNEAVNKYKVKDNGTIMLIPVSTAG